MKPDAETLYRALLNNKQLNKLRRLTYRCHARRDLLLDAVETPAGLLMHRPVYKNSPEVNARTSSPSGRAANTRDGDRRWKSHTGWYEQQVLSWPDDPDAPSPMVLGVEWKCDHLTGATLRPYQFQQHWAAGHAEVLVRADGSHVVLK